MKPCGRCGGPMARKEVRGFEIQACVRCGAVLMDASDLDVIAAGGEDKRTPPPQTTATPSAPAPRWLHKSSDAPKPLYSAPQETEPATADDVPVEPTEEVERNAPPPVRTAPGATPRSAGPRRRTPKPAPTAQVPKATPPPAPPIYRDTERRGAAPTLMPELAPMGEPGLGDFGGVSQSGAGPGFDLGLDPESTEEMARTTVDRQATPVSQKATAPRPPDRVPTAFDDPELTAWTRRRKRTRRLLMYVAMLTWIGILIAVIAVGYLAWTRGALTSMGFPPPAVATQDPGEPLSMPPAQPLEPGPDVDSSDVAVDPDSATAPEPATAEPSEPEPTAPEPAEPEPAVEAAAPEPVVAPPPAPVRPSRQRHIERGWSLVESDPVAAASAFDDAMAQRPSDPEANYGYGYALIRQGNAAGARFYLCRALPGATVETRREVTALLSRNGLACD